MSVMCYDELFNLWYLLEIKMSHDYITFKISVYVNVYHPTLPLENANCTALIS
jgi:hypothetical protein